MKARYIRVAWLLVVILAVSFGLTALVGRYPKHKTDELSVVASFYPLYTAALQVVGTADGVSVSCLTQPSAGCLHDYQLSPAERAQLDRADVLILNGNGMEAFLESLLSTLPSLKQIDTSKTVTPVCGEEHSHEHSHGHEHETNAHTWIDPSRYAAQVQTLCDELCELDPSRAAQYRCNAEQYLQKIRVIEQELEAVTVPFESALLFHESMAYAAESLHLPTAGMLALGEDRAVSAGELAKTAQALQGRAVLFLYDDQYPTLYHELTEHAKMAAVVRWNTAVSPIEGVADRDAWLTAMHQNLEQLKGVAG